MYLSVGHDWNFSAEERAQAMSVGLAAGVRPGRKWNLREKELVERAVKAMEHFIDVKSGGRLSERAMPENGCRGPAKPKEVAHLDIDYSADVAIDDGGTLSRLCYYY